MELSLKNRRGWKGLSPLVNSPRLDSTKCRLEAAKLAQSKSLPKLESKLEECIKRLEELNNKGAVPKGEHDVEEKIGKNRMKGKLEPIDFSSLKNRVSIDFNTQRTKSPKII